MLTGIGNTWADIDNDGDIDCLLSDGNASGSLLFLNNGNATFTRDSAGPFSVATSLRGWGSAFGDYNNDGLVDIFIAAPLNFASITDSCKFLINNGGGNFMRNDSTILTDTVDAYTVPTWSDYDNDGDLDLFIGSGRVNGSLSLDYLFNNNFKQGGTPPFARITTGPLGTGVHDGQVYNWIDFDNDGDLDAYLTNYSGTGATGYVNEMYQNDNGTFVKLTGADVGPIVTDARISLSSTWGDFDNDGDLDCIVTNEGPQKNIYYQSNIRQGSTVFTKNTTEPFALNNGNHWCATSGDYDNDGDLDLFISGGNDKGLFQNNTTQTDFVNIRLIGSVSNKSGIGAKVRVKARGFWQMREISSQNTFDGMNMLNAHFGFGNTGPIALYIDTVIIEWPSGLIDVCTQVGVNQFYTAIEGQCLSVTGIQDHGNSISDYYIATIYPNPSNDNLTVNYFVPSITGINMSIINMEGKLMLSKKFLPGKAGINYITIDIKKLIAGNYTLIIESKVNSARSNFIKK